MSTIYRGIGIGNTSVQAEAFRIAPRKSLPELAKTFPNVESEMVRYQEALAAFVRQLDAKSAQAQEQSVKEILYAQSVMAQDPELAEMVLQNVKEGWSAESAVQLGMQKFTQELLGASDEFGERVADLREIEYRIIQWLQGEVEEHQLPKTGEIIVVAEDLSPMETATFTDVVKGVVTEKGGPTSHTAIICRQLGIAAVVACTDAMKINNGTSLLVNPTLGTVEIDGTLNANEKPWWHQLPTQANPLAKVFANVGSVKDAQKVKSLNAQGASISSDIRDFFNTSREEFIYLSTVVNAKEVESDRARIGQLFNTKIKEADRDAVLKDFTNGQSAVMAKLRIVSGRYRLTTANEKVPITLVNDFESPVKVDLIFTPMNSRVVFPEYRQITLNAKSKTQVSVPIKTIAAGDTTVIASFQNGKGKVIGANGMLDISSTIISPAVTKFTTGAGVLLILAAVAQSVRRVRKGRKSEK